MALEWRMLRDYHAAWAVAPDPPVFVTVDAVVTCARHVLLIERGQSPGKGLLAVPGGMEPLMVLERDPARLAASTGIAVLTVVVARAAGWPVRALADLGAAALLADLGSLLAEEEPGTAGCRWLLDRGVDDFWLRCALVARHARTPVGDAQALHACGGLVFVRLAIAIHDAMQGSGWTDGWRAALATGDAGQWPDGLLGVSAAAFAGA